MANYDLARIKKKLGNVSHLKQYARIFHIFGNLTTFKICWLLANFPNLKVTDLAKILKLS